jgi:hypothetical protein
MFLILSATTSSLTNINPIGDSTGSPVNHISAHSETIPRALALQATFRPELSATIVSKAMFERKDCLYMTSLAKLEGTGV